VKRLRLCQVMGAALLLSVAMINGCNREQNTFEVRSKDTVSAELSLCGQTTKFPRQGETLRTVRQANCEADGSISVRFADRPSVSCPIGYVTSGLGQSFRFKIDGNQCVEVEDRPSKPA